MIVTRQQILALFICILYKSLCADDVQTGPIVTATIGAVWPKPKHQDILPGFYILERQNFKINISGYNCDILVEAAERTVRRVEESILNPLYWEASLPSSGSLGKLQTLTINLTNPCEIYPSLGMDEKYFLNSSGLIQADSIWGILHGLVTFSQLLVTIQNTMYRVAATVIEDEPRFMHRGLLLDTSRHFISVAKILKLIDGMEMNKLNVFHWHIVDDQAFPYLSMVYPELAVKGAYLPNTHYIYNQEDVAEIVEYARIRGIRVIPEFDIPAHTLSWGISHPEILAKCDGGKLKGSYGPMNPVSKATLNLLKGLFREVTHVFPDQYLHIGGEEVDTECWENNNEIINYVKKRSISYDELAGEFMRDISNMVISFGDKPIVWQNAALNGVKLPAQTIVQVYSGNASDIINVVTKQGYQIIRSDGWFLDNIEPGSDWAKFYKCEPQNFTGTSTQKELVIGGEGLMWGEQVNDNNVLQIVFPRLCAMAERLWSSVNVTDVNDAATRLEEQTCRMISWGIPAQPANGPGFC